MMKDLTPEELERMADERARSSIQKWMNDERAKGASFWEDPISDACGDPCRISENFGGHAVVFEFAAKTLSERRKHGAVIDGYCASGCALFADLARPNICITRNAVMAFHMASDEREPNDRADIKHWIRDHGGFPSNESGVMKYMRYPDTLEFWPECGEK